MHVSFSLIHPERADAGERAVRREARAFLIRSGARVIEALRLAGSEHGLALGIAFRDIVLDPGMPPSAWPVSDVLEAHAFRPGPATRPDRTARAGGAGA